VLCILRLRHGSANLKIMLKTKYKTK
jgi:hypothetical protein